MSCVFFSIVTYSFHICADLFPHPNNEDACKLCIYFYICLLMSIYQSVNLFKQATERGTGVTS